MITDKPKPERVQCRATSKFTGERCKNLAVPGWKVCRYHGAGGGNPYIAELHERCHDANVARAVAGTLATKYGLWAKKYLTDDEHAIYMEVRQRIRDETPGLNDSADEIMLNEIGHHAAKLFAGRVAGAPEEVMNRLTSRITGLMKQLGIRRDSIVSPDNKGGVNPQKWFVDLVESAARAKLTVSAHVEIGGEGEAPSRSLPSDQTEGKVIDLESDDTGADDPGDDDAKKDGRDDE